MASVDDLYDIAVLFLNVALDSLAQTDAGTPERAFVGDGQPALDCCGQLVVWNQTVDDLNTFSGLGGLAVQRKALKIGSIPRMTVSLLATRCVLYEPLDVRTGSLPSPEAIQATARMIDQDVWALYLGLEHALREGVLANQCEGYEFLGAQKIQPQGECVGWMFSYRYPISPGHLGT